MKIFEHVCLKITGRLNKLHVLRSLLIFVWGIAFLVSIALIIGSLVSPILGIDSSSTTSESRVEGEREDISDSSEFGNRVLQATIIAAKQENKLANQSLTTMVYNGSLVGPTLRASPGDQIELKLVNSLDDVWSYSDRRTDRFAA